MVSTNEFSIWAEKAARAIAGVVWLAHISSAGRKMVEYPIIRRVLAASLVVQAMRLSPWSMRRSVVLPLPRGPIM
ncbi:hypothetical protein AA982_07545 [Mycolicibacterium senegalense]|nr:hypothetical protein AA982_07545 [Mycolicibacterium senegalense]